MKLNLVVLFEVLLFYLMISYLVYFSNDSKVRNAMVDFEILFNQSVFLGNDSFDEYSSFQVKTSHQNACKIFFPILDPNEVVEANGYKNYGPCKISSNDLISFNPTLNVKCESGENPEYYFKNVPQVLGGPKPKVNWLSSSKGYESADYLLIKCSKHSIHSFVFNKYQESISRNANLKKNMLEPDKKPFNVLLIVLDVVSRISAYENLPKTIEFLHKGYKKHGISAYEFEKTLVTEIHTVNNMAPIIYGLPYESIINEYGKKGISQRKAKKETIKKQIWTHYKNLGYTTMFLHDSVWDFLPSIVGKEIECDHVFVNYWKTAYSVYGWHDISNSQRCAGSQNSHNMSFTYTYQYFNNYPENNKFAYVHTNAGHEKTGNIRTVDNDLVQFMQNFIGLMQSKNESFAMFVIGDHGRRNIKNNFELAGYFESRSAFTSLYLSRHVEDKWDLKQLLTENSKQLLSRFDINLSLKHLAYFPYNKKDIYDYDKLKKDYKLNSTSSVFKEYLSINRTCADLGVIKEFCLCRWIEPLPNIQSEDPDLYNNILQLLNEHIKKQSNTSPEYQQIITLENIEISKFEVNPSYKGKTTIFFVHFTANSIFNIEAKLNYCYQNYLKNLKINLNSVSSVYSLFTHESIPVFLQVDSLKLISPQIL